MRADQRNRFWLIAFTVLLLGVAADWWFYRRCPEQADPSRPVFSLAWIDNPEPRLAASEADGAMLNAPSANARAPGAFPVTLRPVQLESVPSVHRLILRTDFGLEEVEIAGLGGPEAWLPAEANAYLEEIGRQRMEDHLRAAGDALFEVRSEGLVDLPWLTLGGVAEFHWPARGWSGRRLVQLVTDPERAQRDVGRTAVDSGWTYAAPPFARMDALFRPALHLRVPDAQPGFHALSCFDGEREALRASLAQWSSLTQEDLTRRGRAIAAAFAPALPGLEPQSLEFSPTGQSGMRRELRRLLLFLGSTGREQHLVSCSEVTGVLAVSLPGGRIWVRTDDPMPIELLDWVLGHEIIHQYQHLQERRLLEHGLPFQAYPDALSEAHAEALNLQLQREFIPAFSAATSGLVYAESVARVLGEAADLGKPAREYLAEILRSYPEPVHGGAEDARPELMFLLHGGGSAWRGLSFSPQRGADGKVEVAVRNLTDSPLVTRFTGRWEARLRQPRKSRVITADERYEAVELIDRLVTAPFVLELAPRASVTIRLGRSASWMDEWTAFVGCHDPIEQHDPDRH